MALVQPILNIIQNPSHFSAVYAPNWFAFTASFTNSTATDANLIVDLNILSQDVQTNTILNRTGRYKVPTREGNKYVFDPSNILKSFVSYPYNNGAKKYYGSGVATYVNEMSGYGSATISGTNSFPTLAPEQDGIVKYNMRYGLEYNPGATFSQLGHSLINGSYSLLLVNGVNTFVSVGDIISTQVYSGLYTYYNGTSSVTGIINDGFNTLVSTDRLFNTTLGTISGGFIGGSINAVQHIYGTTSTFYAYNGTRQYNEKDINFDNIYYFRSFASASVLFPSTSTSSNFQFMNDLGRTASQAIPILPNQSERGRFLADLYADTNRLSYLTKYTYDSNLNLVGTFSTAMVDINSQLLPYKCYTVNLFSPGNYAVPGYYYRFAVESVGHITEYASIWYKGLVACSRYSNVRIKFLNRQGTWAYWNFNMDNKQTSNITRTEFKTPLEYNQTFFTLAPGGGSNVDSNFSLQKLRGTNTLSLKINETFTLNSDWVTEEQYSYLQQLFSSSQVFIFHENYTLADNTKLTAVNIPIMIIDTSYTYKTVNRDRLFNLTINYKYAFDQNAQNI